MSDIIKFKSGYEMYANKNIIGIDDELEVTEGYDGSIPLPQYHEFYDKSDGGPSKEDMLELCDIMLDRWNKLKTKIGNLK